MCVFVIIPRGAWRGVAPQDLELYLTREEQAAGSFTLVARSGLTLQELHVASSLSRDDMKKAITRVLTRVNRQ